ncbi:hybrid sensor histidine kinase/response regulator [Ramlibacter rhizophilus]|uniref:histidine kinase n=1 Tax=Ramlibacter rhizophilus TaxID=1781167 RepID=A0A4Z0BVG5_9BURK|nr:response regulator [Ramlibacter rhizophilus]TFZ03307.1 response regulator [Ramlibacter rhizophilus]
MIDARVIAASIDRSRHAVLVVDDNPATRYSTTRVLTAAGFRTREAGSGAEALALVRENVSAVVLDVHLPDMSGFDVCRELRAHVQTRTLPVVHLSAEFTRNEDRVAGLEAGADGYLIHPVEPAILVATLQALIRARVAEEGLRRSELRLRAIYDNAPVGIVVLDADGVAQDANPALLELLACRREELVGLPLIDRVPPEWRALASEQFTGHTHERTDWAGRFPLTRCDGTRVQIEWAMSGHVEPGLRIAIATDASEREQLERQRREVLEREQAARAAAERNSHTKDEFIAVLSHELRTPLNAIVGWVAVLMHRQPQPEISRGLQAIERNVKAQARIISDILDVSRINSGKLTLERELVDPAEIVATALSSLGQSIEDKQLRLRVDVEGGRQPAWLDPARYQQILWNLMTNAIKFSDRGSWIDVTLTREGPLLRLTVRDHGQGIAADFLERLFDRFSQAQSAGNRSHSGLGLGLSIVRELAQLHGGKVNAGSAGAGQGATFTVDIPAEAPPLGSENDDVASEGSATAPADVRERPLEGLEILVVEDDRDASEMLAVVLADRGATVRLASDFDSAVAAVRATWPHVLLSDIGLPQRDGHELIRELRQLERDLGRRHLPAVALTAFARTTDRSRALEAGFDRHVAKPLNPHTLVQAIMEAVGSSRPPGNASTRAEPT